jgi:hypothetical protein
MGPEQLIKMATGPESSMGWRVQRRGLLAMERLGGRFGHLVAPWITSPQLPRASRLDHRRSHRVVGLQR